MRGGALSFGRTARLWCQTRLFLRTPRDGGFTVIEVLIVLAITGALFVSAAVAISGRQNQTAFDQAIRQVQSQVQQTVNEVAAGYFPNKASFQCTAGGSGPLLSAGSAGQGTNSGCIFLGKAMQFKVAGTTPEQFTIYTVAGLQKTAAGSEVATLSEARPMLVAPGTMHPTYPDNSLSDSLQNGLTTARMWYDNGSGAVEIGAIAFVNSLAQYSSGSIVSGSGQVDVVAATGTAIGANRATTIDQLNSDGSNRIATGVLNPSGGVFICFQSGGTKQYGIIKIGGDSRELSVTLRMKNDGGTCTYP